MKNPILRQNEDIILRAELHWGKLIAPGLFAAFLLVVVIALMSKGSYESGIMYLIIAFLVLIFAVMPMLTTELVITNKRVYGKTGVLSSKSLDTPLDKVNNVSVSTGFLGNIFNFGKIKISSSSGSYSFRGISNPQMVRSSLMDAIEIYDEQKMSHQAAEIAQAMDAMNSLR